MKIRFLTLAQQELDDAVVWYNEQVDGLGKQFLDELDRAVRRSVLDRSLQPGPVMNKSRLYVALIILLSHAGCGGGGGNRGSGGGSCLAAATQIVLQAENGSGAGQVMSRSNAGGQATVWLHANETRIITFPLCPGTNTNYRLRVRYSNDNNGPTEVVSIQLDGSSVGQFTSEDTGDFGLGWNNFAESPDLGPVTLQPGDHKITISVTGGDGNGIEIDSVILDRI
ncbi:MAG: hypothetical protein HY879_21675 [Deltaproteobacteria bacterium]|nr:hypothetical protein [Deltaproteobacteria bacterium]